MLPNPKQCRAATFLALLAATLTIVFHDLHAQPAAPNAASTMAAMTQVAPRIPPATLIEAQRRHLAALEQVCATLDEQMAFMRLTPEFFTLRQNWHRERLKLCLQLASSPQERIQIADEWLATTKALQQRVQERVLVDATRLDVAIAEACTAEAELLAFAAKNGSLQELDIKK